MSEEIHEISANAVAVNLLLGMHTEKSEISVCNEVDRILTAKRVLNKFDYSWSDLAYGVSF